MAFAVSVRENPYGIHCRWKLQVSQGAPFPVSVLLEMNSGQRTSDLIRLVAARLSVVTVAFPLLEWLLAIAFPQMAKL